MEGATSILFTRKVMMMMLLSAFFHSIGFATPGWFYIKFSNSTVHTGLWYGVYCDDNDCSTDTVWNLDTSYFKFENSEPLVSVLRKYQAIDSVAMAASLIAILMNIVHRKTNKKLRYMWSVTICIIGIFMTGILGIVTSAHFANRLRHSAEFYNTKLKMESPYSVPYSIICTGLGGLVALITYAIVAYSIAMNRDRKHHNNISHQTYNLG